MKKCIFITLLLVQQFIFGQKNTIELIVRADDIGFCHAVNEACIKTYKQGIAKSVEILVPSPWFMESVAMLKENPGFDVGIHLCLTSEWVNLKWRPMTHAPSLTNADGYFCPFIWVNDGFPKNQGYFLLENKVEIVEVEKEFRAQIETARKYLPTVSHLSAHMGCIDANEEIKALILRLSKEYNLPINMPEDIKWLNWGISDEKDKKTAINRFVEKLKALQSGRYMCVEHPGFYTDEMRSIYTKKGENVALQRQFVTDVWTSPEVMKVIKDKKIKLLSVGEVLK